MLHPVHQLATLTQSRVRLADEAAQAAAPRRSAAALNALRKTAQRGDREKQIGLADELSR